MENLSNQCIEDQKTIFHGVQLFSQPKKDVEEIDSRSFNRKC